ncbi:MAG: enoyl-[acyl-carrier protein] reductase [Thermoanaerobacteraceae bacterium]|jgi:enoyl-[acyl-carrier protein] reductase II|uniref:Probable nitronate monooxygenase n=1 Tax=Biomaibacter acetigenes TaxID=2316383 RepID=A0A3G2R4W9_9FIRM|nr:enoyl-[acyl-carrier-protein] reductase FabK [Biomaibacter acetigenes]MDK2879139.1 enoyl-[acyl-carrier protein] reductase [Thermoanaerobacteraceae bacterium]RKL62880.1 enoyl-[acyl-carrier-protein] reductase FabK [Thermoanaerobacteraceae bacterium SP2]AYO30429.1 enoyl-[acyl-carrier-protein] reductase FabK [Biomaibacter acetigenes]MDN5300600.1 enoyl-[acyl-carrier protein] reductase [Thermoanaerobacteraceae bacterium]MDN5312495.1 enoyl-[acyl-carrier protein] reductase [Thermoanaerobacteraceae b
MFHTEVCDLLGIKYPIIQGGMAWVATAELAAAVSNGGGLGIIGAGNAPADVVRDQIRKAKALTDKPFGVNVYFMSPFVDDVMNTIIEEKVAVVTTGAGNPGKYIPRLKEANIKVIPVIASVALAQRLEKIGVDALIAEGMECGGHIGELTTMALVPQVVDAVHIPVIAAGGIADGRGFIAALSLGAKGIQMGTRFVCATECTVHDNYKNAILKAKDRSTVVTGRPTGHPVRVLKNKLSHQFETLESQGADIKELEALGTGRLRAAVVDGDVDNGSVMAGQIAGMVNDVKPAAEIIEGLVNEAKQVLDNMANNPGWR